MRWVLKPRSELCFTCGAASFKTLSRALQFARVGSRPGAHIPIRKRLRGRVSLSRFQAELLLEGPDETGLTYLEMPSFDLPYE